jgi:hypothetical protein
MQIKLSCIIDNNKSNKSYSNPTPDSGEGFQAYRGKLLPDLLSLLTKKLPTSCTSFHQFFAANGKPFQDLALGLFEYVRERYLWYRQHYQSDWKEVRRP